VSKALKVTGGTEAAETAKFIEMVNKIFDCLNVFLLSKGRLKSKPFIQLYQSSNDFRLKVNNFCNIFVYSCVYVNSFYMMNYCFISKIGRRVPRLEEGFQKKLST